MIAHSYARHVPAHTRVGRFVADEPKLSWVFPFLHELPHSDVLITGGTARDAILGRVANGVHVLVHGVPENVLEAWTKAKKVAKDLDIRIPTNSTTRHHTLPISHDLARRDATVNALAYSIRNGILHDPFDGLKDMEEKKLRAVGAPHARFHEEPHLIPRFLRLATELGFAVEDSAWNALVSSSHKLNRLVTDVRGKANYAIPRLHIGKEFLRAIKANPAHGLNLFWHSGVLHETAPELKEIAELEHADGRRVAHQLENLLDILHAERASTTLLVAAILSVLEEGSLAALEKLSHRLHLPLIEGNDFSFDDLHWLLTHRHVLETTDPETLSPAEFEKIFGGKRGDDLLMLLKALYVTERHHSLERERLYAVKRRKAEINGTEHPKLLRGRDLLSLGIEPGPHLRAIMTKVRDAQLSGEVRSKTDALDFARHLICTSDICSNIQTRS